MKIRLKNLSTVLKDYKGSIDDERGIVEYLDFIPKGLFGTTVDAKLFKDYGSGIKVYECCNHPFYHYRIMNDFIEEVIDD